MTETRPTITIKLKPYLQEFVRSDLSGSVFASSSQIIGKLIRPFLRKRPVNVAPFFPKGPEYITFELPLYENFNLRGNYYISVPHQKIIESLLDVHFKRLFYHYMKDKVRFDKRNFKLCIYQFCYDYHFTYDHMNYEMLKKEFYRERKKDLNFQNINKKSCQVLSQYCPDVVPINETDKFPFLTARK